LPGPACQLLGKVLVEFEDVEFCKKAATVCGAWHVSVSADIVGEHRFSCDVVHTSLWKAATSALTFLAQGLNHVKFDDRTVETDFESLDNMVRV
jgi:hypothetical protein